MSASEIFWKSGFRLGKTGFVKVCGCRLHDGGAARTGAGVATTEQSAPLRRIGTFGLAVGAACAFSLGIAG